VSDVALALLRSGNHSSKAGPEAGARGCEHAGRGIKGRAAAPCAQGLRRWQHGYSAWGKPRGESRGRQRGSSSIREGRRRALCLCLQHASLAVSDVCARRAQAAHVRCCFVAASLCFPLLLVPCASLCCWFLVLPFVAASLCFPGPAGCSPGRALQEMLCAGSAED
jgi:hypothetical protein